MESNMSSAKPHFSKIVPIKVKNGIASSNSLFRTENIEMGRFPINAAGNHPISIAKNPLAKPKAAREKATGNPINIKRMSPANMIGGKCSMVIA
jgi:hypothetical protein